MTARTLWLVAAVAVPVGALASAAGEAEAEHGLAVTPFGTVGLIAVHVVAVLSLAVVVAGRFGPTGWPVAWAAAGVAVAGLTAAGGDVIGDMIDASAAGFVPRAAGRVGWCLALVFPWAVAAGIRSAGGKSLVAAAVVAVAVPAVFASAVADAAATDLADHLRRPRVRAALRTAELLARIGRESVPAPDGSAAPTGIVRAELREEVGRLESLAARPLPSTAAGRYDRGLTLAQLDRLAEAEVVLALLVGVHPGADVLLATVLQTAGRYEDSDAAFRRVLREGRSRDRRPAFDGLAENARKRGDVAAAVEVYREAMTADPPDAGYYHFQTARTYAEANRPADAAAAYRAAAAADPAVADAAGRQMARLRNEPFGCRLLPGGP